MPSDRRLRPIAAELLKNPACGLSIEEWGGRVGASGRTLARLFIAETGLSFTRWRTQCRLLLARARLAEGESVTTVAHAMGYASDSAFIAMHRRVYGESPARLWRQSAEQAEAVAASAPRRPQPAQPYCPPEECAGISAAGAPAALRARPGPRPPAASAPARTGDGIDQVIVGKLSTVSPPTGAVLGSRAAPSESASMK